MAKDWIPFLSLVPLNRRIHHLCLLSNEFCCSQGITIQEESNRNLLLLVSRGLPKGKPNVMASTCVLAVAWSQ